MTVPFRPNTNFANKWWQLEVAAGRVPGFSYIHKFGRNPDIDTASGFEAIWNGGGSMYTGFNATSAEIVEVFSSDTNDNVSGAGARVIVLNGLDADFLEITETVVLNGTTPVNTTQSFIRCDRATVVSAGSSGWNEGEITVRQSVTTANVFAVVPATYNRTMIAAYTIPANKVGYVTNAFAASGDKSNGASNVRVRVRLPNTVFFVTGELSIHPDGSSFGQLFYEIPGGPIPGKTDYYMEADSSINNMAIAAGFEMILEEV